jgi:hypothetical protein
MLSTCAIAGGEVAKEGTMEGDTERLEVAEGWNVRSVVADGETERFDRRVLDDCAWNRGFF